MSSTSQLQRPTPDTMAYSYIRWSSAQQGEGDSLKRQSKAAEEWCERHGITLSKSNSFEDKGVSAFKGKNAEDGKLALFFEHVQEGIIKEGSYLLIENLDRISRDKIRNARNTLERIIDSGIKVVTLSDGKVYTKEDLDNDPLVSVMILLTFTRAREESEMKSKRLTAAWSSNTEDVKAGKRIRSVRTPAWLKVVGEPKSPDAKVVVKEKEAKIVQEIFSRFAAGDNPTQIARDLHRRNVPTPRGGQWIGPTISQLVRSEAPYGSLEVGRQITAEEKDGIVPLREGQYRIGNRVIIEVIKDYFPRVIDKETETRVRFKLSNREAKGGRGKIGTPTPAKKERVVRACLTGVIKVPGTDRNAQRKMTARSHAYFDAVSGKYIAAVTRADQVLKDYWPDIVRAHNAVSDMPEGMQDAEFALGDALETLEFLKSKPGTKPALLYAAEAEVEELREQLKDLQDSAGLHHVELPRSISEMDVTGINALVRRVIKSVYVEKTELVEYEEQKIKRKNGTEFTRKAKMPVYDLHVTLKSGYRLTLGPGASGLTKQDGE